MPIEAGTKLGPYEILGPVGAGGMGEVYQARDTRLDRTVAVKVLPSHLSADPALRQRFEREARSVSSLNHPHICTLHDIGHQEGVDFLVMEYLEGETLGARLERGPLPTEELLRTAVQIADALAVAHRQGFVHRDLKPGNVMLTKSGAKLLDFGLAKAAGAAGAASSLTAAPTTASPLTAEGTIVGTFQYMAPEQLEGCEADARSDIFAFGTVLYEMATGKPAFAGRTQASLIASILKEEPRPIAALAPMTPPMLERLVRRCLAKDPDLRWQSASDMADQLRWIAEAGSQAGVPLPVAARRKGRERLWMGLSLVLAVAVLALGLGYLTGSPADLHRPVNASILPPEGTTFSSIGEPAGPVVLSPDGQRMVFAAVSTEGIQRLWLRSLDEGTATSLAGTDGAARPFWSPAGNAIGFFALGKLKKIDLSSGSVLTIADAPQGRGGSWNDDGVIVFTPNFRAPIYKVDADGGEPEPVTQLDTSRHESTHRYPLFLPDGRHFLFMARTAVAGTPRDTAIYAGSIDSMDRKLIVRADSDARYAAGMLLFTRERTLLAQPFDPGSLELTGDLATVAKEILVDPVFSRAVFSVSDNGALVYQTGDFKDESRLVWYDREGRELDAVGDPAAFLTHRLSPDGKKVAASITEPGPGRSIWVYDLARGIKTRLTFSSDGIDAYAQWSPDGSEIVFTSTGGGAMTLFRKETSGAGQAERLHDEDGDSYVTSWSSDGRHVLFTLLGYSEPPTGSDILVASREGGEEPTVYLRTAFNEDGAEFSPDGRWVAYSSDESGRQEVYAAPFPQPTGKWQISTGGGTQPRWRKDGKEIYYLSSDNKVVAVKVSAGKSGLEIGEATPLFQAQINPGAWESYDPSADGQRFLINTGSAQKVLSPITLVLNWTETLAR